MKLDYNIVLIGFMGTGKTTVSEYLNQRYDMDVVDMDTEISKREGMGISEIFEVFGEVYFRDLETALLQGTAVQKEYGDLLWRRSSDAGGKRKRNEKKRQSSASYRKAGDDI